MNLGRPGGRVSRAPSVMLRTASIPVVTDQTVATPSIAVHPSINPSINASIRLPGQSDRAGSSTESTDFENEDVDCKDDAKAEHPCDIINLSGLGGRTVTGVRYQDYAFYEPSGGRYVYRQLEDGTIYIRENPWRGVLKHEAMVARASPAWSAITNAIYARKQKKRADTIAAFHRAAVTAMATIPALQPPIQGAPVPKEDPVPVVAPEEPAKAPSPASPVGSEVPWAPVLVGGGILVALMIAKGGK